MNEAVEKHSGSVLRTPIVISNMLEELLCDCRMSTTEARRYHDHIKVVDAEKFKELHDYLLKDCIVVPRKDLEEFEEVINQESSRCAQCIREGESKCINRYIVDELLERLRDGRLLSEGDNK